MATMEAVRQAALAFPGAVEADHHGIPSFRIGGKIFCTIHLKAPRLMVKLDAEDQRNLAEAYPGLVAPVPGYWGRQGSTFVAYEAADDALIDRLLRMAYARAAPKSPRKPRL